MSSPSSTDQAFYRKKDVIECRRPKVDNRLRSMGFFRRKKIERKVDESQIAHFNNTPLLFVVGVCCSGMNDSFIFFFFCMSACVGKIRRLDKLGHHFVQNHFFFPSSCGWMVYCAYSFFFIFNLSDPFSLDHFASFHSVAHGRKGGTKAARGGSKLHLSSEGAMDASLTILVRRQGGGL